MYAQYMLHPTSLSPEYKNYMRFMRSPRLILRPDLPHAAHSRIAALELACYAYLPCVLPRRIVLAIPHALPGR